MASNETRKKNRLNLTNKQLKTDDDFKKCNRIMNDYLSHLGGKCQQIECIIDTTHSIAALPFAFVQAPATLLAFRFFPRDP